MSYYRHLLLLAVVLFPLQAQFLQQGSKLVAKDFAGSPSFGLSVAISADGNTAIAGAPNDNSGVGAAFIYSRTNGVWTQQGPKLVGAGASGNAAQGHAVAISADGNTAVSSGWVDAQYTGAVWVFTRANGVWTQQAKLVGIGASGNAAQGGSVAISGDGNTILVGGTNDDLESDGFGSATVGAAWVFTHTNGVWTQQGPKLVGTGAVRFASQGSAAALSADGNTAIVGGSGDGGVLGAAWIFTRTNGVWSQQGPKLYGSDAAGSASQGWSTALSADGNTAAIGGVNDNNGAGAMWIFTRANGLWSQQDPKLVGAGASGYTSQGISVALSGDGNTALSGGPGDSFSVGAVWAFTRTNGVWTQQGGKFAGTGWVGNPAPSGPNPAPDQGSAVALSADGHTAIVGGPGDEPNGAAWIFISSPVHLAVSAPATATAGGPLLVTVTALDANNAVVSGYSGTVHFSSTDPLADLPIDSTLVNGAGIFTVTLKTATTTGAMITVTDTARQYITGVSPAIPVQPGTISRFVIASTPAVTLSGAAFNFTVSASDPFGNFLPSAAARLRFTSSDPAAILPADSPLSAGTATFSAVLKTLGSQTITVTGTGGSPAAGASAAVLILDPRSSFNIAQGTLATQSSTYSSAPGTVASLAVDGNLDGNFYDGTVAVTDEQSTPWWQTDLGSSATIFSVAIWGRTDCCALNDFWVFISDTPFLSTDTPTSLQNRAGTFASHQTTSGRPIVINANNSGIHGRYVRVQLSGVGFLGLAEVQVIGAPGSSIVTGLAQGRPVTQSSTLAGYPSAAAPSAVDGSADGNFFHNSVTATNADPNAWWQVDLGGSVTVRSVVISNRTDCCAGRLSDYWVFVSDTPFLTTDTPATLQNRAATFTSHQTSAPSPATAIAFGAAGVSGRYVRVQLSGTDYLSLAEVQVFGDDIPHFANMALGKSASQSSTLPGSATDGPSAAVDGNTDGRFFDGSVTATNPDPNPWWQVDLGASAAVDSIVIFNRTDCCGSRLSNYWVFVSDTPFLPTDTPATLQSRAATFASHQISAPNPSATIPVNAQGRYVRVQLINSDYLSLAEVQVFGTGGLSLANVAVGKSASQSSTLPGSATDGPLSAVDGNTDGRFYDGSVTATNPDSNPWWQVDLGASTAVNSIVIFNRTDCCGNRLSDYWVFVSDTPFLSTDTPATLQNRTGTFASHQTSAPNPSATIPVSAQGRYVRVQLSNSDYLSLAEVQVLATTP